MSFLSSLVNDAEAIEPVLSLVGSSPTAQFVEKYIFQAILIVEFKNVSFTIGNYTATAKLNSGVPASFSIEAAIAAIGKIATGQVGIFTVGDLEIDIQPKSA